MAAGISNVNLNRTWAAEHHPSPVLDYVRVSPLSPLLPMVFTPTTLGKQMGFGFTRQVSLVDNARADRIISAFTDRLIGLASDPKEWDQESRK